MGQRLVRAKTRIKDAGIPFAIPEPEDLPGRLEAVLDAIYAAYTKGWIGGRETRRARDGRAKRSGWAASSSRCCPPSPRPKGMLALMLYAEARRGARRDAAGAYVPLEQQDISLWDDSQIRLAETLAARRQPGGPHRPLSARGRHPVGPHRAAAGGRRQLAGDRRALRSSARLGPARRWSSSTGPSPSPNWRGRRQPWPASRPLADDKRMQIYQPYWAALGHLAGRSRRQGEAAIGALTVAIGLTTDPAVRTYLHGRIDALRDG